MRDTDPMRIRDDAPHHYAPRSAEERDRLIVALRRKGWTLRKIAARLGMSK